MFKQEVQIKLVTKKLIITAHFDSLLQVTPQLNSQAFYIVEKINVKPHKIILKTAPFCFEIT